MRARKHLGQNWLADPRYADRIVDAVDPRATDLVIEIGPGPGALTDRIVPRAGHTIAIELDPRMREPLEARHERDRLAIIEADVLETDLTKLIADACAFRPSIERVRVAANLPYYISSAVLVHLIEHRGALFDATLMLQKEVVERLVARPGGKDYGSLTVFVAMYAEASRLFDVPPGAFRPAPKVTSSVIALRFRDRPAEDVPDAALFNRIVRAAFAQRRKTLGNCLAAGGFGGLAERAGIDPRRRAETLHLSEFAALARFHASSIE